MFFFNNHILRKLSILKEKYSLSKTLNLMRGRYDSAESPNWLD